LKTNVVDTVGCSSAAAAAGVESSAAAACSSAAGAVSAAGCSCALSGATGALFQRAVALLVPYPTLEHLPFMSFDARPVLKAHICLTTGEHPRAQSKTTKELRTFIQNR